MAGKHPVKQGCARIANMQFPRRGRRKSHSGLISHYFSFPFIVATAKTAIPSLLPTKPMPSFVLALIFTSSADIFKVFAMICGNLTGKGSQFRLFQNNGSINIADEKSLLR